MNSRRLLLVGSASAVTFVPLEHGALAVVGGAFP